MFTKPFQKCGVRLALMSAALLTYSLSASAVTGSPASDIGNSFGNNVTCSSPCYDFTVYDNALPNGTLGASSTSKGYFEALVSYATSGANLGTPTIVAMYFSATGIQTPGATTSNWASLVNIGLAGTGFGTSGDNSLTGPTSSLNTGTGGIGGTFVRNTFIQFFNPTDGHLMEVDLTTSGAPVSGKTAPASLFDTTTSEYIGSNLRYSSTSGIINGSPNTATTLGSISPFGGQIAPEMSPLLSFNVLTLLGLMFLLFKNNKYFAKQKHKKTTGEFSIA